MDNKKYDIDAVKQELEEYIINEREIDTQIERLERLITRMTGVGAQILTSTPRAPSVPDDRIADLVCQKEELEIAIRASIERQKEERTKIEAILKHLRNPDERAVIRMRYLDGIGWSDIRDVLFGNRRDFLDKDETYLRRTHRIHGSALVNIAKYIAETDEQNTAVPANP